MIGAEEEGCSRESTGGGGDNKEQGAKANPGAKRNPGATATPPADEGPQMTSGQENALRAAEDYIDLTAFSKQGLIEQLSSPAGDGYSKADATFAANHVDVDWNAEAVEAAEDYLELSSFSRQGLIEQLSSAAGDKFTPAQAQYAVNKVY